MSLVLIREVTSSWNLVMQRNKPFMLKEITFIWLRISAFDFAQIPGLFILSQTKGAFRDALFSLACSPGFLEAIVDHGCFARKHIF